MKKVIALLFMSILLISCGSEEKENEVIDVITPVVNVEVNNDIVNEWENIVVSDDELSEEEVDAVLDELLEWL